MHLQEILEVPSCTCQHCQADIRQSLPETRDPSLEWPPFPLRMFHSTWQVVESCDKPCCSMLLTGRCLRQTDLEILQPPCSSYDLHRSMYACVPRLLNMYGKEHHHAGKNNPGSQIPLEIKLTPYSWVFSGVNCYVKENGPWLFDHLTRHIKLPPSGHGQVPHQQCTVFCGSIQAVLHELICRIILWWIHRFLGHRFQ